MSDKSFRVLLDLTDLNIDSMKYVWINVSPQELLTIADFKSSILRKIDLERTNIKLYVRKGLLLDSETTTILREDDTIKVHYADELISEENTVEKIVKENRKSSRKRIYAECVSESLTNANGFSKDGEVLENRNNQDEMNTKCKKKKSKQRHSLEPENSCTQSIALEIDNLEKIETHKKNNKKLQVSIKNQTDHQICEFFSFNNSECTVVGNKDKSSQNTNVEISDFSKTNLSKDMSSVANASLEVENESLDQSGLKTVNTEVSNEVNRTSSKRKRKRRKRKKVNETSSSITENINNGGEFKSFVYDVDKRYQGKHVTYSSNSSEEEVVDLTCDESFKNPNAETFVLNGSLSNCTVESSFNHPKISTPAQSNKLENPNLCLSGMQNTTINSPVEIYKKDLGLTTTNSIPNTSWNSSNKKSFSTQSEESKTEEKPSERTYSDLPPLNTRPDIGTHIAYKVLELDEHYSPVISDYREGVVKSVNFETEEMEIELLKHVIKPGRIGKFENLREGEIPLPEVKKYDIVKWSSLVEPKLLSC